METIFEKILVVDDDPFVRSILQDLLEENGHAVLTAEDGHEAFEIYEKDAEISLIISDMNMAAMNGLELIQKIRKQDMEVPIIILTVNDRIQVALDAIESGASDYLLKDENIQDTVLLAVERACEKHRLRMENRRLLADLLEKNNALNQSNAKLLELNNLKNKFLSIASHDLRSAISNIIGLSDILQRRLKAAIPARQQEMLGMIYSVSNNMLALLDDLLDVAVIESGRMELNLEPGNLKTVLEERIRINRIIGDRKGIEILSRLGEVSDALFDRSRIQQAIDNYLSNALKYSPKESRIEVFLEEGDGQITVSVKDQGPGIPLEEQPKLFEEFQKLGNKPTGGEPSTGLGLAIVKRVISAHRGSVGVKSGKGEGSIFSFSLPKDPLGKDPLG